MPQVPVYGLWLLCFIFESDNNKQRFNSIKLKLQFCEAINICWLFTTVSIYVRWFFRLYKQNGILNEVLIKWQVTTKMSLKSHKSYHFLKNTQSRFYVDYSLTALILYKLTHVQLNLKIACEKQIVHSKY
jgi:hypothetical protein